MPSNKIHQGAGICDNKHGSSALSPFNANLAVGAVQAVKQCIQPLIIEYLHLLSDFRRKFRCSKRGKHKVMALIVRLDKFVKT